jgi:hypothetical protein
MDDSIILTRQDSLVKSDDFNPDANPSSLIITGSLEDTSQFKRASKSQLDKTYSEKTITQLPVMAATPQIL